MILVIVAVIGAIGTVLAARVSRDISVVKKQFVNNGGSSMRDAVDRIERNFEGMSHRVDTIGRRLEEHLTYSGDGCSGVDYESAHEKFRIITGNEL